MVFLVNLGTAQRKYGTPDVHWLLSTRFRNFCQYLCAVQEILCRAEYVPVLLQRTSPEQYNLSGLFGLVWSSKAMQSVCSRMKYEQLLKRYFYIVCPLGFRLRLADILVRPMQRLTKYSLLLGAIRKHISDENDGEIMDAMVKYKSNSFSQAKLSYQIIKHYDRKNNTAKQTFLWYSSKASSPLYLHMQNAHVRNVEIRPHMRYAYAEQIQHGEHWP